jgi:hypothetical protein
MKKNQINYVTISASLMIVIMINSCSEQGMESSDTQTNSVITTDESNITNDFRTANYFTKTTGAPIDREKANQWIRNYALVNGQGFEYQVKAEALKEILSRTNCNGISFRYGLNADNQLHIIPVGVDNTGTEMKSDRVTIAEGHISWELSKEFTNRYWGTVRAHYFGANTFERLFKSGDCKIVKITAALNDYNQPQLLLTNANGEDSSPEDESRPCPPHCEKTNN